MSLQAPPSFFDDENANQNTKLWRQPPSDKKDLSMISPFLKGTFYKRSKQKGTTKQIMLFLDQQYLYYLKDEYNIVGYLDLTVVKMELILNQGPKTIDPNIKQQMNGIKLSRNQRSIEFFTPDENLFKDWKKVLNYRLIQTTFHDEFMVTKMIGKGSFAKVYLATKKENQLQYAIKAFNKEFMLAQHKGKESLINEIIIMRSLHNDHLIHLYEVYETTNSIYFIVDLLNGGELLNRVKNKDHFNEMDLRVLIRNLLLALQHLHEKNIMHRDLKPENLLLKSKENDFDLVCADFGLATFIDQGDILFKRCGTPGFVAPEVLLYKEGNEFYDVKCDVFSAGVIFYLLLTGKQPFQGKDYKEILRANKACQINWAAPEFQKVSNEAMELLQAMMQPDPTKRPSSSECLGFRFINKEIVVKNSSNLSSNITLRNYEVEFVYNVRNKVMDSQELTGSLCLQQGPTPCMNGQVNTVGSLGMLSQSSLVDSTRNIPVPQQSRFAKQYSIDTKMQEENVQSPSQISVDKKKSQKDFYKMALQNQQYKTFNSGNNQGEERKKDDDDQQSDPDVGQEETGLQNNIMNFQKVLKHGPSK